MLTTIDNLAGLHLNLIEFYYHNLKLLRRILAIRAHFQHDCACAVRTFMGDIKRLTLQGELVQMTCHP